MGNWPPSRRRRNSLLMKDFSRKGHIVFAAGTTSKGRPFPSPRAQPLISLRTSVVSMVLTPLLASCSKTESPERALLSQ